MSVIIYQQLLGVGPLRHISVPTALNWLKSCRAECSLSLVDSEVAHVAEENGIGVVTFTIVADAADSILINVVHVGVGHIPHCLAFKEALFL